VNEVSTGVGGTNGRLILLINQPNYITLSQRYGNVHKSVHLRTLAWDCLYEPASATARWYCCSRARTTSVNYASRNCSQLMMMCCITIWYNKPIQMFSIGRHLHTAVHAIIQIPNIIIIVLVIDILIIIFWTRVVFIMSK